MCGVAGFVASENASQVAHLFCMGGHVALLVPRVLAKAAAHCMSGVEGAMNVCLCVRVDLGSCLAHKRKTTFGFVCVFAISLPAQVSQAQSPHLRERDEVKLAIVRESRTHFFGALGMGV